MDELKDLIQTLVGVAKIGGILFAAGMAWQLLKTLRENLVELKASHTTLTELVASRETRITVLETKKGRK
ncbi:MAG: hypothetical protein E6Q97_16670 [Desulfurellales bacterium]|nr:MAG: hypothetical protein E6Q97_16670 [Desulfurellales bacterium]